MPLVIVRGDFLCVVLWLWVQKYDAGAVIA